MRRPHGCHHSSSDDGSGGGGDGSEAINAYGCDPQSPLLSTDTNETCGGDIIDTLYTGLVTYTADGDTEMAVADSIEPNDDATEFTIKLKDDWTFTNGEAVTADSFIDAWNYGAASKNAQKQQYFYENIEGYDAVAEEGATADTMSGLEKVSDTEFKVKLKLGDQPEQVIALGTVNLPVESSSTAIFTNLGWWW